MRTAERHPTRTAAARELWAFGLRDTRPLEVPDADWDAFRRDMSIDRTSGIAVAAVEAGILLVPEVRMAELFELHSRVMVGTLRVERSTVELVEEMEAEGTRPIVLKGPAIAHTAYADPSWRPFGDVDLLIQAADWQRAVRVLDRIGYRRATPEPRAGFETRFAKAAMFRRNGVEVDLHRTLADGAFGMWSRPEQLVQRTAPLPLGGTTITRLDDTALLLHGCIHASLGWWPSQALPVRDVAQIATHLRPDWDDLARLASDWRLPAVVAHAFATVRQRLDLEPPAQARVMAEAVPTRRELRALDSYVTERRRRGGVALSAVGALPGIRMKAAYLRALLWPERDFLRARASNGKPSHLRRLLIPLRWLRRSRRLSRGRREGAA